MLYRLSRLTCKIILVLFFRFEIKGNDCIPSKGPFIVAANHVSNFDPPAVGAACYRMLTFLAKDQLFATKFSAWFFRNINCIPLRRTKSDLSAIRTALKVLQAKPIALFPQGGRKENFEDSKAGVGFLAKRTGVPIIAARVFGTETVLPKGAWWPHFNKVRVSFKRVEYTNDNVSHEEIAALVVKTIKEIS